MARPRIAILASGEGTTAEVFIQASAEGLVEPEVALIITNNRSAGILHRVEQLNKKHGLDVQTAVISGLTHPAAADETVSPGSQTLAEEQAILKALQDGQFDLVVLMGYMKKVGPQLVQEFGWDPAQKSKPARLLNTHPGLLPATKGLYGIHVQEHVLQHNHPKAGQTLHAVAQEYDEGPIIASHALHVKPGESAEELFERVKILEKKHLPHDVAKYVGKQRKKSKKEAKHG